MWVFGDFGVEIAESGRCFGGREEAFGVGNVGWPGVGDELELGEDVLLQFVFGGGVVEPLAAQGRGADEAELIDADPAEVFAEIRGRKDRF